jgi:hypothetical protein
LKRLLFWKSPNAAAQKREKKERESTAQKVTVATVELEESDYLQWSAFQFATWMAGKYQIGMKTRDLLQEENITGKSLAFVESKDLSIPIGDRAMFESAKQCKQTHSYSTKLNANKQTNKQTHKQTQSDADCL